MVSTAACSVCVRDGVGLLQVDLRLIYRRPVCVRMCIDDAGYGSIIIGGRPNYILTPRTGDRPRCATQSTSSLRDAAWVVSVCVCAYGNVCATPHTTLSDFDGLPYTNE